MPVILDQSDFEKWLDPSVQKAGDVTGLLHPYRDGGLTSRTVSTLVNSPKNEGEELVAPIMPYNQLLKRSEMDILAK